jgi:hypothetical protein
MYLILDTVVVEAVVSPVETAVAASVAAVVAPSTPTETQQTHLVHHLSLQAAAAAVQRQRTWEKKTVEMEQLG